MEKVKLEIFDDVVAVIEKLHGLVASEIELEIPEGSVLFENSLNLKLIKKSAEKIGKTVSFSTPDEFGLTMLDLIDSGTHSSSVGGGVSEDFVPMEVSVEDIIGGEEKKRPSRGGVKTPKLSFSFLQNLRPPKVNMPELSFNGKGIVTILITLLVLGGLGFGVYKLLWAVPKAVVEVVVNSQPLIKSFELEVSSQKDTDVEARILKGKAYTASVSKTESIETTGEKIVGDKAEGRIKIINRTTEDKDFDKGDELKFEDDDDLVYILDDDVTVPGGTTEVPANPSDPVVITPGTAEADVVAEDIGKKYNLDSGETLEFDDYSTSKYVAEVVEDIDGGSSDTINIVAQEDLDNLSTSLTEKVTDEGPNALKTSVEKGWVLIKGSESTGEITEEFDHKVGDEADNVELVQTVNFYGLAYNDDEINKLLDELIGEFVPDGFELISDDREVNIEVLGNTDITVLNSTEADLQITVKSFVIPELDEEKIKEDLVGTKIVDAEKILGSIRNVNSYGIEMDPNIPLMRKLPSNPENITLKVKKD